MSDPDPQRLARFQREAKVLASLSHLRIATIHDVRSRPAGATVAHYLVMERG